MSIWTLFLPNKSHQTWQLKVKKQHFVTAHGFVGQDLGKDSARRFWLGDAHVAIVRHSGSWDGSSGDKLLRVSPWAFSALASLGFLIARWPQDT